eukprot:2505393-Rhodomonas_salina.2
MGTVFSPDANRCKENTRLGARQTATSKLTVIRGLRSVLCELCSSLCCSRSLLCLRSIGPCSPTCAAALLCSALGTFLLSACSSSVASEASLPGWDSESSDSVELMRRNLASGRSKARNTRNLVRSHTKPMRHGAVHSIMESR